MLFLIESHLFHVFEKGDLKTDKAYAAVVNIEKFIYFSFEII